MPVYQGVTIPDRINDIIKATVADALGRSNPESAKDVPMSRGGGSAQAQEYTRLARKVPKLNPEAMEEFFGYSEMFLEFLKNKDPTLLPVSAKPEILIENLSLWQYDQVIQLEKELGFEKVFNNQGKPRPVVAKTLLPYKEAAEMMLKFAHPAPEILDLIDYKKDMEERLDRLINDRALAGPSEEANHYSAEFSKTCAYLLEMLSPSFVSSFPTGKNEPLIPKSVEGLKETEKYLVERIQCLSTEIPEGLYDENMNLMVDYDKVNAALEECGTGEGTASILELLKDLLEAGNIAGQEGDDE